MPRDSNSTTPLNIFFRLLVPSTALFVFFTLAWMTALLGDGASPVAKWFAKNGMWPIGICFAVSMISGVLALSRDNKRQRTSYAQLEEKLKEADDCESPRRVE